MNVIPELNLNKHPRDCKNCSLVDAEHMVIDKDSFLLHTENSIISNNDVTKQIQDIVGKEFKIIYAIPCNKEIVFFVLYNNEIKLIRYNENLNYSRDCGNIEYNGGQFTGTFTYNKNNLIISFSEFGDSLNVPLKVINLGEINKPINNLNTVYHPICPEVKIPECITEYTNGSVRKGWYYIFIRYKLSSNNYTQWFNTGKSIFIDTFTDTFFENYYISSNQFGANNNILYNNKVNVTISNDYDICNISFNISFYNLDNKYDIYQIGFINVRKDTTKCYRSNDIDIKNNKYLFNHKFIIEESVINLINSYYNYYNVKTLDNYNNLLYIANYKEYEDIKNININDISIDLIGYKNKLINNIKNNNDISRNGTSGRPGLPKEITGILNKDIIFDNDYTYLKFNYYEDNNGTYIKFIDFKWVPIKSYIFNDNYEILKNNYINFPYDKLNEIKDTDKIHIKIYGIDYYAYAKNIKYYFNINNNNSYYEIIDLSGYKFIINDFKEFSLTSNVSLIGVNNQLYVLTGDDYPSNGAFSTYEIYFVSVLHFLKFNEYKDNIDIITSNVLNSNCVMPNEYYNFYVHFINKYGESTQGISINKFKNITINDLLDTTINNIGNTLIHTKNNCIAISCKLNKIPDNYIGYYISYEKFEHHIIHKGYVWNKKFISNSLNVELSESLDFNFNIIKIDKINKDINIVDKKLYIADTYNNIALPTNIDLTVNKDDAQYFNDEIRKAYLINNNINGLYNNKNKILIQCSKVCYDVDEYINLEINNAFKSTVSYFKHSIKQKYYEYPGDGEKDTINEKILFDNARKVYYPIGAVGYVWNVYNNGYYEDYLSIPTESYQFLNKPQVIFFPIIGTNTTEEWKKGFQVGCITEMKNTVDLFQQKNPAVYEMCPKTYINYIEEDNNLNEFPKTIRRSNPIADESDHIGWRFFETDNYKNIIENKGNIIKLSSIGNIMLVHTEHSLFQFRADQGLKTETGDNVSIGANDIWDISYQEIFTSELGYAGINNINQAIVGQFGYIFYEADKRRFFRYDENSIKQIDLNVNNYIRKLDCENIVFVDDVDRDRLLITLYNDKLKETLSYNYKYNVFVSRHKYNHCIGYNTKNKIYLLDYNIITGVNFDNIIKHFDKNNFNDYIQDNTCSFSVIINTDYELNKMLEFIQYRITKLDKSDDLIIPRFNPKGYYYPGDILEIFSEECYTGKMNIYTNKANTRLNSVREPNKPYRELGIWNFNYIRNDINSLPIKKSDDLTRFYGNWFVITFSFTPNTTNNCCIEIESINYNYSKNLT